jgi:cell division protease FtsH
MAGPERRSRLISDGEKRVIAYHEGGHALVAHALPNTDPVHKISIIPRGLAALGYTMQLPLEDRYLLSREELLDKMAGLMGGRAAEEIVVGSISTGASNDFKQATEIARLMVTEYGMSEALGPVSYGERSRSPFLSGGQGLAGLTDKSYSERTQVRIDEEVTRLIEESMQRARDIVTHHRDALGKVAARLLQQETLEGDELRRILAESGALPVEKEGPAAAAAAEAERHPSE